MRNSMFLLLSFGLMSSFNALSQSRESLDRELLKACERGNVEEANRLLDQGADINGTPNNRPICESIFITSTLGSQHDVFNLLIKRGAKTHLENKEKLCKFDDPIHYAARKGNLDLVKKILREGGDIETKAGGTGYTALHEAVSKGHKEIVTFLLSQNANVEAPDCFEETPIHRTLWGNKLDIMKLLLTEGSANVDVKMDVFETDPETGEVTRENRSPLFLTASNDHNEQFNLMLKHAKKISKKNIEESFAMFYIKNRFHRRTIKKTFKLALGRWADLEGKPKKYKKEAEKTLEKIIDAQKKILEKKKDSL